MSCQLSWCQHRWSPVGRANTNRVKRAIYIENLITQNQLLKWVDFLSPVTPWHVLCWTTPEMLWNVFSSKRIDQIRSSIEWCTLKQVQIIIIIGHVLWKKPGNRQGKHNRGRPKDTWRRTVEGEMKTLINHTRRGTIGKLAQNRPSLLPSFHRALWAVSK